MKKSLLALAVLAALTPLHSNAQTRDSEAVSTTGSPLAGNLAIVSDYRFRGMSQSYKLPAVQGGLDYAHESGFYLGNWNSSVSGNQYTNGASLEMDFYGGFKIPLSDAVTLDIGGLYYYYPGSYYNVASGGKPTFNNFELYVGSSFGPLTAKASFTTTDYFGVNSTTGYAANGGSKGSYYLDLGYSTEIAAKTSLVAHVGYQNVKNYSNYNYVDYKLGVTYDYTGWILGAAWIGTNVSSGNQGYWTYSEGSGDSKFVGNSTVVLSVSRAF